jgi:hypothetical protein
MLLVTEVAESGMEIGKEGTMLSHVRLNRLAVHVPGGLVTLVHMSDQEQPI